MKELEFITKENVVIPILGGRKVDMSTVPFDLSLLSVENQKTIWKDVIMGMARSVKK